MKLICLLLIFILFPGQVTMENKIQGMDKVYKYVQKELGLSRRQWDLYRNSLAYKESQGNNWMDDPGQYMKFYKTQGGSSNLYDGRYQMGIAAKVDGVDKFFNSKKRKELIGVDNSYTYSNANLKALVKQDKDPSKESRQKFINDALLQEQLFAGYTVANMNYLDDNEKFKEMPLKDRIAHLTYAHNVGHTKLKEYIDTGRKHVDGNGHDAKNYIDNFYEHSSHYGKDLFKTKPLQTKNALAGKNLFSLGEI